MELEVDMEIKKKEHENVIHLMQKDRRFKEEELEAAQQKCMSYIIENLVLKVCLSDMKYSFGSEKRQQEFRIKSSEMQLAVLESQINILQEKGRVRDEEFEEEQHKYMNSMFENFYLQRYLSEMNENYFILSHNFLQQIEASRCAGELISQLESSKVQLEDKNTILMNGIEILLEVLNINKKPMITNGNEDVVVQTLKDEISNRMACICDLDDENQRLHNELSVYRTFLKQISLEKVLLAEGLKRFGGQLLGFQSSQDQLFERCETLGQDINDKKQLYESLKSELESLCRLLSDFSMDLSNLREENDALEEENNVIIEEAATLEHLYWIFRSSNAESLQSLKVLDDEIISLIAVNNDHVKEIIESKERIKVAENERKLLKESFALLEGLRSHITILEFDLFAAGTLNEDLIHQVESEENLLKKKSMEVLKAYTNLQCAQEEVTELCTKLDALNKEVDEAKIMRVQLEGQVAVLLEGNAYKDVEIVKICEENRMLNEELNKLNGKVEILRKNEHILSSELKDKMGELDRCEAEIMNLFNEVQLSAINSAVFEEKMFEWAISYDVLEICTLVQREIINEETALTNTQAIELKDKLDGLENENRELKAIWSTCLPLFISLYNGINSMEKQAHQLANFNEDQDVPLTAPQEENVDETMKCDIIAVAGALQLQNLVSKVKALEKLLTDTSNQLKSERLLFASNLEASRRETEGLNTKNSDQGENQGDETSRTKHGQLMKDIELDQVSNSNVLSRIHSGESEDQMLKLWETAEKDCNDSVSDHHGIEPVEEFNFRIPLSEPIAEKEVGIDKLEMSTKESQEDWNRRVTERLSTDADKLSALKTTVKELEEKITKSAKSKHRNSSEFDAMQTKAKQAEKEILELVNTEEKLRIKVEEYSKSRNGDKITSSDRRQMFEQIRIVLDRIEKVEMELQEIYFFFANLDGEAERNKTRGHDRSPRVLLRDYIDGWRAGKAKKSHLCGCMRPKVEE